MDVQYGIAVTNKFALFIDEDEDPLEILRQKEEESKNAPVTSKKDKKKASAKKSVVTENRPKQQEQQIKKDDFNQSRQNGRGGRGGRGRELRENDGSRPPRRQGPRENRDYRGDENVPPEFKERGDANRQDREGTAGYERGRGGRGGFRGGRGRGGGRGGPRPESGRGNFGGPAGERRREFDRHSGTDRSGVKPTDKRDGSGAHNWGSYRDDVEDQGQGTNPADTSVEFQPAADQPEAEQTEGGETAAPPKEDEEPKEMTLDEWKAMQDQNRMKAQYNIRRAGEGVDSNQWKKGVAYKKKNMDEDDEEESEEEEEEEDDRYHRKQIVTDIRITFADNPRRGGRGGRGSRGGRGGPRGGGRGGFDRPERPARGPRESAPRVDDETDFPALVKSEA